MRTKSATCVYRTDIYRGWQIYFATELKKPHFGMVNGTREDSSLPLTTEGKSQLFKQAKCPDSVTRLHFSMDFDRRISFHNRPERHAIKPLCRLTAKSVVSSALAKYAQTAAVDDAFKFREHHHCLARK